MKKAILKIFAIFTWKKICWSLFLIKLLAFRLATLLERDSNTGVFLLEKFQENLFWRMLLNWIYRKWLFETSFLVSSFKNHPDKVILQKYQSLSNKSFKHNPTHMPFLYLTPTLFLNLCLSRMFISKGQPIKCQCCPHLEASQLICCSNQFYMRATLAFNKLIHKRKKENLVPLGLLVRIINEAIDISR